MTTRTNAALFGDTLYHYTDAYKAGVQAARSGTVSFRSNPHRDGSQRAIDWAAAHDNTQSWDHRLMDGTDTLTVRNTGQVFTAPEH